ncbi:MAG: hypothetical protein ACXWR0_05165 [Bdellovibrio sp.]
MLDRQNTVGPLLELVTQSVVDHIGAIKNANDEISRHIGFSKLKAEIQSLNQRFGISNTIVANEDKWRQSVGQICVQMTNKPIWLPTSDQQIQSINLGQPVFWLTGNRGEQVSWCLSFVPAGQQVDFQTLLDDNSVVTFTGGLFFSENR